MSMPGTPTGSLSSSYLKICSDLSCQPMPDLLSALTSGQRYCSISSPTETLPDGAVISLCAILPMSSFELVSFHNLNLSVNSWAAIADACSKTRALQRLVFKDCGFRDVHGMPMFARALSLADLQSLELINSPLSDDFVSGLVEGSLLSNERFTTLRLAGCGLGDSGAVRLARAIEGVGMMCALRLLDLSYNRIGDAGACALAAMLIAEGTASSVPLNSLELEGNQLSDVGGLALCKGAKAALMLQRLNLSLNPGLTSATLHGLADAVRFNTGTLKEVSAAGCRAGEDAAIALLRAAHRNTTLQLLDIRGVPLGPEGVAHLCALLRYTTSLNTLRVDVASADGAEAIARDLPSNRSLMHLTLGGPVPDGLLAALSEILAANTVARLSGSPAASSPHIHAWIEESTNAYHPRGAAAAAARPSGAPYPPAASPPHGAAAYPYPTSSGGAARAPAGVFGARTSAPAAPGAPGGPAVAAAAAPAAANRSRSPSPPHEYSRSPRSEAGGSVYSHATHRTGRTHRTHRTNTSYMSFGGFTETSRRTIMVGSTPLRVSASLAAGGAAEKAALIFRKHDQNEDNHLNKQEMLAALDEMGVLHGIKAKHIGRFLDSEFKKADWDKDGRVSLQDFISYYEKIAYYQAQMAREGRIKSMTNLNKQMVPQGVEHNTHMKRVFKNYARLAIGQGRVYADGVPLMNSAQFHRLCQDAGFMEPEGRLSTTAVDVIFTRYRAANSRRMAFKDFISALAAVAYEMGFQFDEILEVLGANAGSQQPLAPSESAKDGEATGSQQPAGQAGGAHLRGDPSFDALGVPLATVHEGAEKKKAASKSTSGSKPSKKPSTSGSKSASTTGPAGRTTSGSGAPPRANGPSASGTAAAAMSSNPLYDSDAGGPAAAGSGAPAHSSFNVHGALAGGARGAPRSPGNASPGRSAAPSAAAAAAPAPGVQPQDLTVLEARVRLEMEAAVRALEERLERQAAGGRGPGGGGGVGGGPGSGSLPSTSVPASTDALVGAKLRQLEGQVLGVQSRQDELDRMAAQLGSLKDILNKLAEEMVRIKSRADSAASTAASALSAANAASAAVSSGAAGAGGVSPEALEERLGGLAEQVGAVQLSVAAMGQSVGELGSRVDGVAGQLGGARAAQQATAQQLAALQAQTAQLGAQVAALPPPGNSAAGGGTAAAQQALEAQVAALEKKLLDRLSRYDGALLQVAKQVDALDQRLREEQEGNMKTIEMLLAAAGAAGGGDMGGGSGQGGSVSGELRPPSSGV